MGKRPINARWGSWLGLALLIMLGFAQGPALAQSDPYLLRPGDTIVVSVLEDPELDSQVLILPDGRISLPVAGTIVAAGRSPQALAQIVRSRLSKNFVQPPNVTITVSALAEEEEDETLLNEVYVLGEVARPGRYEYDPEEPIDVLKALSLAGGVGPFAARDRIQVRERIDETETLRVFDYEAVEDGILTTPRDLAMLPNGAVIVVPERGLFD